MFVIKFCFRWIIGGKTSLGGNILVFVIIFIAHPFASIFLLSDAKAIHYVMHVELFRATSTSNICLYLKNNSC